jgi:hypothetical protein
MTTSKAPLRKDEAEMIAAMKTYVAGCKAHGMSTKDAEASMRQVMDMAFRSSLKVIGGGKPAGKRK